MATTNHTYGLRLVAETAAIMFSILAAFAIDAWWEDLQEQKHLQKVLRVLGTGFSENIEQIGQNIDYVNNDREQLKLFINMSPEEATDIPADESFAKLEAIWRPGTNFINNSYLIATLDSENLPLLNYPRLQEAISLWRAEIGELDERGLQLAENEREALRALGRFADIRTVLALTQQDLRVVSGPVLREVREDVEVMSIAGRKVFLAHIHLESLRLLRERSELVLSEIRQALNPSDL